eukprot:s1857_g4.t1
MAKFHRSVGGHELVRDPKSGNNLLDDRRRFRRMRSRLEGCWKTRRILPSLLQLPKIFTCPKSLLPPAIRVSCSYTVLPSAFPGPGSRNEDLIVSLRQRSLLSKSRCTPQRFFQSPHGPVGWSYADDSDMRTAPGIVIAQHIWFTRGKSSNHGEAPQAQTHVDKKPSPLKSSLDEDRLEELFGEEARLRQQVLES